MTFQSAAFEPLARLEEMREAHGQLEAAFARTKRGCWVGWFAKVKDDG